MMLKKKIDVSSERLAVLTYLGMYQDEKLAKKIKKIFEKHGWCASIHDNYYSSELYYIFDNDNKIEIHETPFSQETNIELTEEELFDGDNVRDANSAFKLIKKRIGEPTLDLEQMLKDGKLEERDYNIIKEITKEEGLIEVHDINGIEFRCGARTFRYFYSQEDFENYGRECLEDGELWRDTVYNGNTILGLNDWIDEIVSSGEIINFVNSYDCQERGVDVGNDCIPYIRVD